MNGKKILDRLIFLFICINIIILAFNIKASYNRYTLSARREHDVLKVLEERNVIIDKSLPLEFHPQSSINLIYEITNVALRDKYVKNFFGKNLTTVLRSTSSSELDGEYKRYNYSKLEETISFDVQNVYYENSKINLGDKPPTTEIAIKYGDEWIKRLGIEDRYKEVHIEEVVYDKYIVLTYFPKVNDIKVEDLYVEMVVYQDGIKNVEAILGDTQVIKNSQKQIISADIAIFGIREYIEKMSSPPNDGIKNKQLHIKEIELVYKKDSIDGYNVWGNKSIPMYKISIQGLKTSVFVNAYTNDYVK